MELDEMGGTLLVFLGSGMTLTILGTPISHDAFDLRPRGLGYLQTSTSAH